MKKIISLLLVLGMILTATMVTSFAGEAVEAQEPNSIQLIGVMGNDDADRNVTASAVMDYEELVHYYMNEKGVSEDVAKAELAEKGITGNPTTRAANAIRYQVFGRTVEVTSAYKPRIDFYCEVSHSGSGGAFWSVKKIYNVELVTKPGNISKTFNGTLKYWLRGGRSIEYVINGKFYNNGTTTISGGGNIGVGESATLNFSVSVTSSYYADCYERRTATLP